MRIGAGYNNKPIGAWPYTLKRIDTSRIDVEYPRVIKKIGMIFGRFFLNIGCEFWRVVVVNMLIFSKQRRLHNLIHDFR